MNFLFFNVIGKIIKLNLIFLDSNPISTEDIIYEGDYFNGLKIGKGILKKRNGEIIYSGYFKEDKFDGYGTLYINNGYVYEGNFINGKKYGEGTLYSYDRKFKYEGDWVNDEKEGNGLEYFPDGTKFEGEFLKGKKNGNGIFKKVF